MLAKDQYCELNSQETKSLKIKNYSKNNSNKNILFIQLQQMKEKVKNKNVQNNQIFIQKVSEIFRQQFSKDNYQLKVLLECLNLITIFIHQQQLPVRTKFMETLMAPQFIKSFLLININEFGLINMKSKISICIILQQIQKKLLIPNNQKKYQIMKFTKIVCSFIALDFSHQKISFDALKILSWILKEKLIKQQEFNKYFLLKNVSRHIKEFKGNNVTLYQQAFKIIIKLGGVNQAYGVFKQLTKYNNYVIQGFFSVIKQHLNIIPTPTIIEITRQQIFQNNFASASLFEFLKEGLKRLSIIQFIGALQNNLIQIILSKWKVSLNNDCISSFIDLIHNIKTKGGQICLGESINEMFKITLPQIIQSSKLMMQQRNRINQQ